MSPSPVVQLASILILGIAAQWVAWKLHQPSILFLLLTGIVAGPILEIVQPDLLFQDMLNPVVSLSVAVILFEGGLTLSLADLPDLSQTVGKLVSVGAMITWLGISLTAYLLLQLSFELSFLLGAILIVTGPTVITPLLEHLRPQGKVGAILKWEGILIDPLGAMVALLVFEIILTEEVGQVPLLIVFGVVKTLVIGGGIGVLMALVLSFFLKKHLVPDFLTNPVTLMMVVASFLFSNHLYGESGLLAVTVMGIALGNQKLASLRQILEFKETLRHLLISGLFVLLAARLKVDYLHLLGTKSILFFAVLLVIIRPLAVFFSTQQSDLPWQEKVFLSSLAPRGIVAAAIASLFALQLKESGYPQAESLVAYTFFVIIVTVAFYGVIAGLIAKAVGLADPNPQGVLFLGANVVARCIASLLQQEGYRVLLVDTNRYNVQQARQMKLPVYHGNLLSEQAREEIQLNGLGKFFALTPNDEINSLAALHFEDIFGQAEVYQLYPSQLETFPEQATLDSLRARLLFRKGLTWNKLRELIQKGGAFKKKGLNKKEEEGDVPEEEAGIPTFLITLKGELKVATVDSPLDPKAGQTILSLTTGE